MSRRHANSNNRSGGNNVVFNDLTNDDDLSQPRRQQQRGNNDHNNNAFSNPRGDNNNYNKNNNDISDEMAVSVSSTEDDRETLNTNTNASGAAAKQIRYDTYNNSHNDSSSTNNRTLNTSRDPHAHNNSTTNNQNVTVLSGSTVSRTTANTTSNQTAAPPSSAQLKHQGDRPRPPTHHHRSDDDGEEEEYEETETETETEDEFPPRNRAVGNNNNNKASSRGGSAPKNDNNLTEGTSSNLAVGMSNGGRHHHATHDGDDDNGSSTSSDGCNGRLYDLLQTEPDVPAYEIQQIFARTRLRAQYREAYRVLANSDKKRLYDIVGEPAVQSLNKSWGDMVEVLGSTVSTILYGLGLLSTVLCLFLFFTFLPVHIDGRSDAFTWHSVHAPLYVLFCLGIAGGIFLFAVSCLATNSAKLGFRHSLGRLLLCVGYAAFAFIVGSALHDNTDRDWMPIFVILIVADGLTIVEWMTWLYPKRIRALFLSYKVDNPNAGTTGADGNTNGAQLPNTSANNSMRTDNQQGSNNANRKPSSGFGYQTLIYGFMAIGFIDVVLAIVRYVFIGLKIDGEITFNWYGVVTPTALRFVTSMLYRYQSSRIMNYIDQRSSRRMYWGLLGTFILNSLLIITTYLIAGYLEKAGGYDLVYAFIPVYFVLAYLFFASIFTAVYLYKKDRDFSALEDREMKDRAHRRRDEQHGFFGAEGLNNNTNNGNAEKPSVAVIGIDESPNLNSHNNGRRNNNNNRNGRRGGAAGELAGDTDEEGSSSGEEMCISEATHISDEEDHRPFGRGNSTVVSASTINTSRLPLESEPINDH